MILTLMKECCGLLGCALRQQMSISYILTSERESHLVDGRFHSVWCTARKCAVSILSQFCSKSFNTYSCSVWN